MNCERATRFLVAYLDGEVTASEATLIRGHLAGCDACRGELASLSALRNRVGQFLHLQAAQAAPSPQAWNRLQTRLTKEARPSSSPLPAWRQRLAPGVGHCHRIGGALMKKGFAATAALIIALATVAFVPSVRAQVENVLYAWFHFQVPDGEYGMVLEEPVDFLPLYPTYLPAGLHALEGDSAPMMVDLGGIEMRPGDIMWSYHDDQRFVVILQGKASPDRPLPKGQEMTINGQPAALVTGLAGTLGHSFHDARLLTWNVDGTRIQMVSDLPLEEMVRIAESLAPPTAVGEAEPPFPLASPPAIGP